MRPLRWGLAFVLGFGLGGFVAAWAQPSSDLESIVTILRGRLEECRLANKELTAKLPAPPAVAPAPATKPGGPGGKSN